MALSWILRSLSPSIAQSVLWMDNALDVWKDLYDRFSQGDVCRISDLQEEMYAFKQNNLSVTDYFTQLKILWDEFMNLRVIPVCSCVPQCSCDALKVVKSHQDNDHVIRFLKGLSDSYAVTRTQILMMEPLPNINKVFSKILQQERQLGLGMNNAQNIEPTVFAAQTNAGFQRRMVGYNNYNPVRPFYNGNRPPMNSVFRPQAGQKRFYSSANDKPMCSFCGASGHTIDICFKKHGYPPGFRPRVRPQSFVNQVGEYMVDYTQEDCYDSGIQNSSTSQNDQIGNQAVFGNQNEQIYGLQAYNDQNYNASYENNVQVYNGSAETNEQERKGI
ncbi:uncharacterized protein LOC126671875 [Mercurialis annua]|uniref:uncharacterized protein LOC126671875 n=1 Tax=Mercurialis annua TaxID=3986 RepID=UPI002160FB13|nr:uncharacterized protein LOC126671875 [Mercurialis annua]